MRWLLLLVGIGCLAWSLSMAPGRSESDAVPGVVGKIVREITYGPGADERDLQRQMDIERHMVEAGYGTPGRLDELADESLRRTGAHALNIVGWGSLIVFGLLTWRKKPKQQATPMSP